MNAAISRHTLIAVIRQDVKLQNEILVLAGIRASDCILAMSCCGHGGDEVAIRL